MSAAASWYYATGSDPVGPYSRDQMTTLVTLGVLKPETLVWSDGMADWTPVAQSSLATVTRRPVVAEAYQPAMVPLSAMMDGGGGAAVATMPDEAPPSGFIEAFGEAIGDCFGKFASGRGRARRAECWLFALFGLFGTLLLASLDVAVLGREFPVVGMVFALLVLTPLVAVTIRRLHDIDRSGWWVLIGAVPVLGNLALLVLCSLPGTEGHNRFG